MHLFNGYLSITNVWDPILDTGEYKQWIRQMRPMISWSLPSTRDGVGAGLVVVEVDNNQ